MMDLRPQTLSIFICVCPCAGQTGSYFSMAPEVLLSEPYNEKADIFSLGVMMYEVFGKCITAVVVLHTGRPDEAINYAYKV